MQDVHVKVNSYGPGRPLSLVYMDPISGKKVAKSSGTTNWREAERIAGELERELRAGRYAPPSKITWQDFRSRYLSEKLAGMPESTQIAYTVALDHLGRVVNPDRLAKLTSQVLSGFVAKLRNEDMRATTIARHLRHIKAALRWAERQGMLTKAPMIEMPRVPKGSLMKGRPITGEEFERLVEAAVKARPGDHLAWTRLLTALWWSGLRLSEILALDWEEGPFVLDTSGEHPVFRIAAEGQKSNKDELCPAAPEFCQWVLNEFPADQRVGKVLRLTDRKGKPFTIHQVGRTIALIGEKAGVVVRRERKKVRDKDETTGKAKFVEKEVLKHATAHDLRRSFCTRWAKRVMPATLQRLARHSHITTTLNYYVAQTAAEIAADIWAEWGEKTGQKPPIGNRSGNNGQETKQGAGAPDRT